MVGREHQRLFHKRVRGDISERHPRLSHSKAQGAARAPIAITAIFSTARRRWAWPMATPASTSTISARPAPTYRTTPSSIPSAASPTVLQPRRVRRTCQRHAAERRRETIGTERRGLPYPSGDHGRPFGRRHIDQPEQQRRGGDYFAMLYGWRLGRCRARGRQPGGDQPHRLPIQRDKACDGPAGGKAPASAVNNIFNNFGVAMTWYNSSSCESTGDTIQNFSAAGSAGARCSLFPVSVAFGAARSKALPAPSTRR